MLNTSSENSTNGAYKKRHKRSKFISTHFERRAKPSSIRYDCRECTRPRRIYIPSESPPSSSLSLMASSEKYSDIKLLPVTIPA